MVQDEENIFLSDALSDFVFTCKFLELFKNAVKTFLNRFKITVTFNVPILER